ncbi:MAG: peptide ABC transporter [Candidatus Rokuibacteriota bacterium]|nr:MAG: peptide ABC transporter [Candidatus Rokubacteria bacterium]PYO03901.1 MAG: peptide ABC transporter [Candidatus Rokubacteria bacterium]
MRMYIARRFLHGLLVLWLVSLVIFSLVRILPGDAVIMQLDQAAAPTPEILSRARQELGLERPFLVQYRSWITSAVQGDLGRSLITRRPVTQELLKRINLTSHLAVMSIIVAMLIALPIGVLSAVRQDTVSDYVARFLAVLGLSLPDFWLATVIITFLAIWVQWIPPIGFAPLWEDPGRCLGQLLIPAFIIGARLAAVSMRMTRSSLLEVLRQDYIRTARAKGARERAVIVRHALKNAFIPVITVIGQQFSVLLGGTVIVEFIFLQPGVGSLMLDAVLLRDYTLIQGAVLFFAVVIVVTNLLVDLSYAWLDPRIRYR